MQPCVVCVCVLSDFGEVAQLCEVRLPAMVYIHIVSIFGSNASTVRIHAGPIYTHWYENVCCMRHHYSTTLIHTLTAKHTYTASLLLLQQAAIQPGSAHHFVYCASACHSLIYADRKSSKKYTCIDETKQQREKKQRYAHSAYLQN